jgi:hypothetical protein
VASGLVNSTWTNVLTGESVTIANEIKLDAYQYIILKK